MNSIIINSLEEYIDLIPERESIFIKIFYRGQANKNWKLIPSFYRLDIEVHDNSTTNIIPNYTFVEDSLLNQFLQKGVSLLRSYDIKNNLDLMVVGQHHGLPTRLLDWTDSPLLALFFAVENLSVKEDGCVFQYLPTNFEDYQKIATDKYFKSDKKFWFIYPQHINERVKAQSGFFTLHPLYKKLRVKSLDELIEEEASQDQIAKIIIPVDRKEFIRKQLDKLNINTFSIYPDLDGLTGKIKYDLSNIPFFLKGKRGTAAKN